MQQLFDSTVDVELPSEVLTGYWNSPWTSEEMQRALDDVDNLRKKEQHSQLGQGSAIDELARRIETVLPETPHIDMGML